MFKIMFMITLNLLCIYNLFRVINAVKVYTARGSNSGVSLGGPTKVRACKSFLFI